VDAEEPPRPDGLPPGVLFVVAGLIAVAAGTLLPMGVAEEGPIRLDGNTLLADFGDGWLFLAGVVAVTVCLWCWWHRGASWLWVSLPGVAGLLAAGVEAARVAGDEVWGDQYGLPLATRPGAGIWTVAIGSLLVAVGGSALRGVPTPGGTKAAAAQEPGAAAGASPAGPATPVSAARASSAAARAARPAPRTADDDGPAPPLWRRPENDPPLDGPRPPR
jgi:hypothetical protein